jgi:hypothetical protein
VENFRLQCAEPAGEFFNAVAGGDDAHNEPDGQSDGNSQNQCDEDEFRCFHCFSFQRTAQLPRQESKWYTAQGRGKPE